MTRPANVHVLGRNYAVTYELDNSNFGECDTTLNEIDVADGLPLIEEQDTLLHEVLHAVWFTMDIGLPKHEEHVVRKMATGLLLVLQQNPELTAYLTQTKP